jgi:F-type H+-transporting ATPase subunit gamma
VSDSVASLRHQIAGARDLHAIVRTMKAVAASSIGQYERAMRALADYDRSVSVGLGECFRQARMSPQAHEFEPPDDLDRLGAIVFGSDQGLVGPFNDVVAEHAIQTLAALPGTPRIWAVGERVQTRLADAGFTIAGHYPLPGSIDAVASLVGQIQIDSDADREQGRYTRVYLFHNRPTSGSLYEPVMQRLLPLDALWQQRLAALPWPRSRLPEILGGGATTLRALVREYLFITLFRSCAESLASENASRLAAMERADSNIRDLVEQLDGRFRQLRQSSIDEELFDVLSGYEALSGEHTAKVSRTARSAP